MLPREEQPFHAPAGTDPEAARMQRIFPHYRDEQEPWAKRAFESDQFYNGEHWTEKQRVELEARGESPVVHNVVLPTVETKVAMLTANNPAFKGRPVEDSDVGMSQVWSKLILHDYQLSNGNEELKKGLFDYCKRGGRLVHFWHFDPQAEFGKGRMKYTTLDPLKVYPDPNSKDLLWRDAKRVFYRDLLTYDQVAAAWPDRVEEIASRAEESDDDMLPSGSFQSDGNYLDRPKDQWHTRYEVLEMYEMVRVTFIRVFDEDTGDELILSEPEYEEWLTEWAFFVTSGQGEELEIMGRGHEAAKAQYEALGGEGDPVTFHYSLSVGPDGNMAVDVVPGPETADAGENTTVIISPVPRGDVTEAFETFSYQQPRCRRLTSVGQHVLVGDVILPVDRIPLVPGQNRFNRTPYPGDDIEPVKGIQQQINYTQQKILVHLASSASMPVFVPEGAFTDKKDAEAKMNRPGRTTIYYNAEMGAVVPLAPPPLPNELYLEKDRNVAMIERILGVYEFSQGAPGPDRQPFRGSLAQDERSQRRLSGELRSIEASIAEAGRVYVQLAQAHYTQHRVFRIVNPNTEETEAVEINGFRYDDYGREIERFNDVTVGVYDMVVVGGSTLPTNRMLLAEHYERLFAAGVIDRIEFLKKLEVFDIKGILERDGEKQKMMALIEQLQNEVKELRGDRQTDKRQLESAERKVAVEKFKTGLSRIANRAERDQQVGQHRITDAVRRVEEASQPTGEA